MPSQNVKASPSGPKSMVKTQLAFAAGAIATQTVTLITQTLAGSRTTDRVVVNSAAALPAGLALGMPRISADGVISLSVINPTAAGVAGGNMTLDVVLLRFSA